MFKRADSECFVTCIWLRKTCSKCYSGTLFMGLYVLTFQSCNLECHGLLKNQVFSSLSWLEKLFGTGISDSRSAIILDFYLPIYPDLFTYFFKWLVCNFFSWLCKLPRALLLKWRLCLFYKKKNKPWFWGILFFVIQKIIRVCFFYNF